MTKVPALYRHFVVRGAIRLARGADRAKGWWRGVSWSPRVLRAWTKGFLSVNKKKRNSNHGERLPVFYINLNYRLDRKSETLEEFARINVEDAVRVAAIRAQNGALGCARSHVKALEALRQEDFGIAMICEDDVEFLIDRSQLDSVLQEFQAIDGLGVLCLANRVHGPRFPVSKLLAISNNIQMAACYVVKPAALKPLLASFQRSVEGLSEGRSTLDFAIDQRWKEVQTSKVFFSIPRKPVARQRRSYSDIEKKVKFYR
jgi:glycosyl transferase family 25